MEVIAITKNGLQNIKEQNVKSISVGGNLYTNLSKAVINKLVSEANLSGQMQIYDTHIKRLDGKIDANESTPLYTNGQVSVIKLIVNNEVIWSQ